MKPDLHKNLSNRSICYQTGIYQPPIEQSDWSDFTAIISMCVYVCVWIVTIYEDIYLWECIERCRNCLTDLIILSDES